MGKPRSERTCSLDGCDRPHQAKGYCYMHWQRWRRGHPLDAPLRRVNPGEWGMWHQKKNGYIERRRKVNGRTEWQHQHRLVWELANGRELLPGETVHHKNGVRNDNRIENLELWVTKQPAGQRPEDLLAWADWIIATYRTAP